VRTYSFREILKEYIVNKIEEEEREEEQIKMLEKNDSNT